MRATTIIGLFIAVFITSFCFAQGRDNRRQAPRPPTCNQPQQRHPQPERRYERRDDHRDHGRRPITLGSIIHDIFSTDVVIVEQPAYYPPAYPTYQTYSQPVYEAPIYVPQRRGPSVIGIPDGKVIINVAYPPGTTLRAYGDWVYATADTPAHRRENGDITVIGADTANNTSLCIINRGGANMGDSVVIAPPSIE